MKTTVPVLDSDYWYNEEEIARLEKEKLLPIVGFLAEFKSPYGNDDKGLYPFENGDTVLILGEIENMPGHCVLADKHGNIHFGYHTSDFRKLDEDEI